MTTELELRESSMTASAGRGILPGLRSPFPLEQQLPAMLADDPFVTRFLLALDEVIAPAISVIDCFDSYLDPRIAPTDMVRYMGAWLLATIDDAWTEDSLRRDVSEAHLRSKWGGTARGIRDRLLPNEVSALRIKESGSTITSTVPTDPESWPEAPDPAVSLTITPREKGKSEVARVTRIVQGMVPAHVSLKVTVGR